MSQLQYFAESAFVVYYNSTPFRKVLRAHVSFLPQTPPHQSGTFTLLKIHWL